MSYANVYSSKTGNTKSRQTRCTTARRRKVIISASHPAAMEADTLYVGLTDKGNADESTSTFEAAARQKHLLLAPSASAAARIL
ncbi:MAG: flavodoxin family protein [Faecalibacterium prausnitzii]